YPDLFIEEALEKLGFASEHQLYAGVSKMLDIPYVDLNIKIPSIFAVRLVLPWVLKKHMVIPLACDSETIEIATACPGDIFVIDDIAFATDRQVIERLARRRQIIETLHDILGGDLGGGDIEVTHDDEA